MSVCGGRGWGWSWGRASPESGPGPLTSVPPSVQLAHAIRLLLEYTDSNYEEKKYTLKGEGNGIPSRSDFGPTPADLVWRTRARPPVAFRCRPPLAGARPALPSPSEGGPWLRQGRRGRLGPCVSKGDAPWVCRTHGSLVHGAPGTSQRSFPQTRERDSVLSFQTLLLRGRATDSLVGPRQRGLGCGVVPSLRLLHHSSQL